MRKVETQGILNQAYHKGLVEGKRKMEDKLLQFAEQEIPLEINGRAWFLISDIQHLKLMFAEMEAETNEKLDSHNVHSWEEIRQSIFNCISDLYLTEKPRQEIADTLLKYLAELDKHMNEKE